jgi:hypothetical protein
VSELTPHSPGKAKDIFRALALELAVADKRPSAAVSELVAETLPKWAYAIVDPVFVLSGLGAGQGTRSTADRRLKNLAKSFDCQAIRETGKLLPRSVLREMLMDVAEIDEQICKQVSTRWGQAPALEKTISRWRKEPDYRSDVEATKLLRLLKQDT